MIPSILVFLIITGTIISADWLDPFFKPGPRTDVNLRAGDPTAISMDEEILAPIVIAVVTGYSGVVKPQILSFEEGNNFDLGLDFVLNGASEWEMTVTKRQDYEQVNMQNYRFNIQIETKIVTVQITILNIFDNPPIMTAVSSPCSIPELTEADYDSMCLFNVFDIDGMTGNVITFEVQGTTESSLFEFRQLSQIDLQTIQYTLIVKQTLYYDQRALYNFRVLVRDKESKQGSLNVLVEVQDMPNKEPIWVKAFASEKFNEKTEMTFDVIAIDGDTGINTPICYKVQFEALRDYSDIISIGAHDGIIHVNAIDRDARKNEFYPFKTIAHKCNNVSSFISGTSALIIEDINDNYPEIYFTDRVIQIREETFATLFSAADLYVEDIDLGPNASYDIILTNVEGSIVEYSKALNIVPQSGYQQQSFTISVADISLIDFEDVAWQEFDIVIQATETYFEEHQRTRSFKVQLLNWNDELPMFDESEYIFEVNETVGNDFLIGTVRATDRDIDDWIEYFIIGNLDENFSININDGELKTTVDNPFDYERQTQVFIQIQARDNFQAFGEPTHTTFTQVRISVLDINDEPPTLTMPRRILSILENSKSGVVTEEIEAFDPDTTANLKFTIDWAGSYAVKPGFPEVDRKLFEGCFIIEEKVESINKVFGVLSVNPSFELEIDYEEYELVYLSIIVEDLNQAVGPGSATGMLVVQIEDENDNAPEFVGDTLTITRRAIEEAETGTLIGNIMARDIDGPKYNKIQYSMTPIEDTPEDWLTIDASGAIIVMLDRTIGCDVPKRDNLKYEIMLSDGDNETKDKISIDIVDVNNKSPVVTDFTADISIYEDAKTGDSITTIPVTDLDRDEPNNLVHFYINYRSNPLLQRFFAVDEETGHVFVNLIAGELDRDNGEPEHFIRVSFEDNYGGVGFRHVNETIIHLTLLDVNDNAPQMPVKAEFKVEEDAQANYVIDEAFEAPDKDDPATPNSQVLYEILSIEPVEVDADDPKDFEDLFAIESYSNKYGRIIVKKPLRGFSGRWRIEIRAYDRGDIWDSKISLSSTEFYFVNVEPVNFNVPVMVYPRSDATIRLDFDVIAVGRTLTLIDGRNLQPFEGFDEDAGIGGDLTFELSSENDDQTSFEMFKLNRKQSELRTTREIEERTYILNVTVFDGKRSSDKVNNIRISFVNKTGEPYFNSPNMWSTDFTENDEGKEERRTIPEATDPKNVDVTNDEDKFLIYYFIDETFKSEDSRFFQLDKVTRELTLKANLDREEVDNHELRIICTNSESYPSRRPSDNSYLTISVTVNDVNDNSPTFEYKNYAVGVSETDTRGKNLLTLKADDPDLNDVVTYRILNDSITVTDDNLNNVKDTAFLLNQVTGALELNFQVQSYMKGYFEFQVEARDLVDNIDVATVKVYLVAEANRVTFIFMNNVEVVRGVDQTVFAAIFSAAYESECVIDEILASVFDGKVQEGLTDVRVHFVKNNEALEAREILEKSSDIVFITQLNLEFVKLTLNLQGLPKELEATPEKSKFLVILLAALCGVFGVLFVGGMVFHVIMTRNYRKEIKLLVDTNYLPEAQGPEKNMQALPNTNVYSERMFNPIVDLDTKSILSNESDDFAGLSENPIFNIESPNGGKNPLGLSNGTDEGRSSYI